MKQVVLNILLGMTVIVSMFAIFTIFVLLLLNYPVLFVIPLFLLFCVFYAIGKEFRETRSYKK